jgi:hypothetical protein
MTDAIVPLPELYEERSMRTYRTASALTLLSIVMVSVAAAQTAPQNSSTAPDSASSPHQRAATSIDATEAPANNGADPAAAATPHQQQATTQGSMARKKAMKDCMAKQKASNSAMSKADMKKACTNRASSSRSQ